MNKQFLSQVIIIVLLILSMVMYFKSPSANIENFPTNINASRNSAVVNAIEIVSPSVVGINVTQLKQKQPRSMWDAFFFLMPQYIKWII